MYKLIMRAVGVFALSLLGASANAALIHTIDANGILTGAAGVLVGGKLYDVRFKEGSCVLLFSGCDEPRDFFFQTRTDARTAGQALLDQVLLDISPPNNPAGLFDSTPALTNGCTSGTRCDMIIPYAVPGLNPSVISMFVITTVNYAAHEYGVEYSYLDRITRTGHTATDGDSAERVFAVWDMARIPEPASLVLLGAGLLGWGVSRRRSNLNPAQIK